MPKDAYYFSHDANARSDPKILRLLSVYGMEGYGRYWVLVEMMREQSDYCLPMDGKYDWDAYAMQMQCDRTTAAQFVHDCIDVFGLFCSDGNTFWSSSLRRRMEYKDAKSKQARMAAQARWDKEKTEVADANDMRTQCGRNADAMQVKERKGKEKKEPYPPLRDLPKDDSNRNTYPPLFEDFWNAYPRKTDKGGAYEKWRSLVVNEGADPADLVTAAEHYAQECEQERREERYVKLAATFLAANKERWREYLEPPAVTSAADDDYYKPLTPWVVPE